MSLRRLCTLLICFVQIGMGTIAHGIEDSVSPCVNRLRAVPLDLLIAAAKETELTLPYLKKGEAAMIRYLAALPIFTDEFLRSHPELVRRVSALIPLFSGSVSARVVGLDNRSAAMIDQFMEQLHQSGVTQLSRDILTAIVQEASQDPQVYRPFSMAGFILQGRPSIEAVFANLPSLVPGSEALSFPSANFNGPYSVGPRQMEMVRAALQFSQTTPQDHVLEIGYGTPSTLVAISFFTRASRIIGIDDLIVPGETNQIFKARNIEFVPGYFPDSPSALETLKKAAPYSLIYSLDVIKASRYGVLQTSAPPYTYAKALYDLLAEGGTIVIMNDFYQPPYFSKDQAQLAGFQVVRWHMRTPLPAALSLLMPYSTRDQNPGIMSVSVLRKGDPVNERVRQITTSQKPN